MPGPSSATFTTLVLSMMLANSFFSRFSSTLHEIAIGAGQQARRHLDHRHLAAERGVDGPELEADVAAADHEQRLRARPAARAPTSSPSCAGCRARATESSSDANRSRESVLELQLRLAAAPRPSSTSGRSASRGPAGTSPCAASRRCRRRPSACRRRPACRRGACRRRSAGSPNVTPQLPACFASSMTFATCSSAFDGMQPR